MDYGKIDPYAGSRAALNLSAVRLQTRTRQNLLPFSTIQCKTSRKKKRQWILGEKSEAFFAENHFYVMIDLGDESERPSYHVVPSKIVAATIKKGHSDWLKAPSASGKPRKDSQIRNFSDKTNAYLERWDLLGLNVG
jgi:hypothetical protein